MNRAWWMAAAVVLAAERHAQLWINHDKPQTDALKHAPDYYE